MSFTVPVALLGWPLVALALCAFFPGRRAVIVAYVAAWLFLPVYSYAIPGLPDWTKTSATSISLLLGLLIFDFPRIASFRPRWFDALMTTWCLLPFPSSLLNGLGFYDGFSTSLNQAVVWGLPYFFGRIYFVTMDDLGDLAMAIFIGGLVYLPFCMYELRMSPQLHSMVYGFHQHSFAQTMRFGGWRPTVFMEHGLMVGMWMSMATLVGTWLWASGRLRSVLGLQAPWLLVPLGATAVLCKSTGALVLLVAGLLVLLWFRRFRNRAPLYVLGAVAPLYILLRVVGGWSGTELMDAASFISSDRAGSLETRFTNEDLLSARAMERPIFGWAGWGRGRVNDDTGRDISTTDGLWIIEFGYHGFSGLIAMMCVFLLPLAALVLRVPVRAWTRAWAAPAAALALVVVLYLIDCIANSMITPIYILAAGGIAGLLSLRGPIEEPAVATGEPEPTGS